MFYAPVCHSPTCVGDVRLTCIRHAASVYPEPRSNSPSNSFDLPLAIQLLRYITRDFSLANVKNTRIRRSLSSFQRSFLRTFRKKRPKFRYLCSIMLQHHATESLPPLTATDNKMFIFLNPINKSCNRSRPCRYKHHSIRGK